VPAIVALNRFPDDTDKEIALLKKLCKKRGWKMEVSEVFAKGGEGCKALASAVIKSIGNERSEIKYTYDLADDLRTKILKIAKQVYGADGVDYTTGGRGRLRSLEKRGYGNLPVCIAKTQFSLSHHKSLRGRPTGFEMEVVGADVSAGAGFVVVYMGDVRLMPGLPEEPAALRMNIDDDGDIFGVS